MTYPDLTKVQLLIERNAAVERVLKAAGLHYSDLLMLDYPLFRYTSINHRMARDRHVAGAIFTQYANTLLLAFGKGDRDIARDIEQAEGYWAETATRKAIRRRQILIIERCIYFAAEDIFGNLGIGSWWSLFKSTFNIDWRWAQVEGFIGLIFKELGQIEVKMRRRNTNSIVDRLAHRAVSNESKEVINKLSAHLSKVPKSQEFAIHALIHLIWIAKLQAHNHISL